MSGVAHPVAAVTFCPERMPSSRKLAGRGPSCGRCRGRCRLRGSAGGRPRGAGEGAGTLPLAAASPPHGRGPLLSPQCTQHVGSVLMAEGRHQGRGHPRLGGPGHTAAQDGEPGGANQARSRGVGAAARAALPGCPAPPASSSSLSWRLSAYCGRCRGAVQRFAVVSVGKGDFRGWFVFVEERGSRGVTAIQQQVTADFHVSAKGRCHRTAAGCTLGMGPLRACPALVADC